MRSITKSVFIYFILSVTFSYMFTAHWYLPSPFIIGLRTTILTQEMDGQVFRWLEKLGIIKCKWFYKGLSFEEIMSIDRNNIDMLINRVRYSNGINAKSSKRVISKAAKKKIVAASLSLRERPKMLKKFLAVNRRLV